MRRALFTVTAVLCMAACSTQPTAEPVQVVAGPAPAADQPEHLAPPTTTTAAPAPRPAARPPARQRVYGAASVGDHPCGPEHGLPPCWVMQRESGGNPEAYNPTGCYERKTGHRGCTGKWQCSHSTCRGTGTEEEQDAEARALWDGGKGCAHWSACP